MSKYLSNLLFYMIGVSHQDEKLIGSVISSIKVKRCPGCVCVCVCVCVSVCERSVRLTDG